MVGAGVRSPWRWSGRDLLALGLTLLLAAALLVVLPSSPANAAPCDAPVVNEIACENTKTGNPSSEWAITGAGSTSIQGFATDISVNRGSTIGFKVKTTSTSYRLDIYRMGYYGGMGARKVATVNPSVFPTQPACLNDATTGLIDCGNWTQTASWAVPATAVSGIYFARLVSGSAASHIMFIVRDDASTSDLLFQTSDTTWQAYNDYGGNSLYVGNPVGRAYKVSYNRPFNDADTSAPDFVWNAEYPMVRFLEANGYNVSYTTGIDTERRGNLITNHKTFLSVGHDEYWSGNQRVNVEAARNAGVNLAFFSGNEVFWKTRWEKSISADKTDYRTLVTYKETHANAKIDPAGANVWTGTWRDPRFSPPGDGGRPENALTGTIFNVNCCTTNMVADASYSLLRFWRNTRVANLTGSATTTLGSGILGYEWDESPDNGYRPAGLIFLSTTNQNVSSYLQDYGSNYAPGNATHHLTMYRAPSGALVFGAGTVQWAWGLDDNHTPSQANSSDVAVKQATVNLFADMGAQPATLQSGLVAAAATTDTVAPTSVIAAPSVGATIPVGQPVTIMGTAADTGGRVAGVEVSVDNGASWHPADGTTSWSYTTVPSSNGTLTILSRATDDSARTETPSSGRTVTVGTGTQPPGSCPCTIWPSSATPSVLADADTGQIEVGLKFRPTQNGSITGIRFYKGPGNTGTHTGSLWTVGGANLATGTFTAESTSGWQQMSFAEPVPVTANTTYVASYFAPNGRYSVTDNYFTTAVNNGPLSALADGTDGVNGVYKYGATGFPTTGYRASNYWVDPVFTTDTDTTAPTVTSRQPAVNATGVATTGAVTATFSEAIQPGTVSIAVAGPAGPVAGSQAYDSASRTTTLTPSAPLAPGTSFTATVSGAKDLAGNTMTGVTWSFTTAADTTAPSVTSLQPAAGATNAATSTTVTAIFSEAVQQSTIVVSLSGPAGAVAGVQSYDASSRTVAFIPAAPLTSSTAYTAKVSGAKDLAGNTMTDVTWSFTTAASDTTPPTITAQQPASGATNVATSTPVSGTFSEAIQSGTASIGLSGPSGAVAGGQAFDSASRTVTFTPTAALAAGTSYTATVSGAKDTAGNTMNAVTWTFSTAPASPSGCPCSIWPATTIPAVVSDPDTGGIELGVKFRASQNGTITGIRFFKGAGNTGAHTGSLWNRTGTRLAQATFTGETASGWQQVTFASPIAVTAGTTYVASYFAPNGRYSVNEQYFASAATTNGPLTALRTGTDGSNGVYRYGSASAFPNSSYASSNYWVDVVFTTS